MRANQRWSRGRMSLRIGGTILALALLVYLLYRQGWSEISSVVSQISIGMFLLLLAMTLVSRVAIGGRWHVLLCSAGVNISLYRSINLTFAGLFASNFLPTTIGGDVVRLAGVLRLNFNRAVCIASLVVDRLVGMVGMAMALPLMIPGLVRGASMSSMIRLSLVIMLSNVQDLPAGARWKKLWHKVVEMMRSLLEALSFWIKHPHSLVLSLLMTWVHMAMLFGSLWVMLQTMGEPVSFWLVAGMWSLTYFITLLPVSINGLGVQELSMTFLFTQIGGVSEPTALTLAFLIRIVQMFASLPGVFYLPDVLAGQDEQPA